MFSLCFKYNWQTWLEFILIITINWKNMYEFPHVSMPFSSRQEGEGVGSWVSHFSLNKGICRESLLKGKDNYGWPPYTNYFRSAAFYYENTFFYFFTKQGRKEANGTEPTPSVRVPWYQIWTYYAMLISTLKLNIWSTLNSKTPIPFRHNSNFLLSIYFYETISSWAVTWTIKIVRWS